MSRNDFRDPRECPDCHGVRELGRDDPCAFCNGEGWVEAIRCDGEEEEEEPEEEVRPRADTEPHP